MHWESTIVLGGFKDKWKTVIVYFKTNLVSYNCYYLHLYINLCFIISCNILLVKDHWNQRKGRQFTLNGQYIIK